MGDKPSELERDSGESICKAGMQVRKRSAAACRDGRETLANPRARFALRAGATLGAMSAPTMPIVWTLTDDRAGNLHQAQALALALGGASHHVALRLPAPWRWLAPRGVAGALRFIHRPGDLSWPDIAVGCGRQAALALRALKRHRPLFTVQILDPRIDTLHYDIVVTPAHDQLECSNVIRSIGAIHGIDDRWLAGARQTFPELATLPRPLYCLLIGGPHREAALTESSVHALVDDASRHAALEGGSVFVCGSRRTPAPWRPMLRALALQHGGRVWMEADDGPNPYRGCLAYADRVVVTADSVNMLSEACALGVPVCSFAASGLSGKLARFDHALRRAHLLSTLDHPTAPPLPLRETPGIAERILARWRESRGR
jgi:uncharacterized protein